MTEASRKRGAPKKQTPIEAFELNMADAVWMVELAEALDNQRTKRTYRQTRERVGEALRIPKADWDAIEVVESDDFFVIIKRNSDISRESLQDRTVLLRHAVVAACAAAETYFADKVTDLVRPQLRAVNTARSDLPRRLREINLSVGDVVDLDHDYRRLRRGLAERVVLPHIQTKASVDPAALGELLSLAAVKNFFGSVDHHAGWEKGRCHSRMTDIAQRRNVIAHTGDRKGRGRNSLGIDETRSITDDLTTIIHAAEKILTPEETGPRPPERSTAVYTALVRCADPVSAAELAELSGAPRNTVAGLLAAWTADGFADDRFPGVVRVARGRYRYEP